MTGGLWRESLPLLLCGLLNIAFFLFLGGRFFLLLFLKRETLGFPPLPRRVADNRHLSELPGAVPALGRSLRSSLRLRLDWLPYKKVLLGGFPREGEEGADRFPRGVYRVGRMERLVQDHFGLFRVVLGRSAQAPLTVYPARVDPPLSRTLSPSREAVRPRRSLLKDSSFYESRLYYPGDDPRRINWKLRARHGELFVKEGYRESRTGKSLLILLNAQGESRRADRLIRLCGAFWRSLAEEGRPVVFCGSGRKEPLAASLGSAEEREDCLAALPPVPLLLPEALRGGRFGGVYLFSLEETLPASPAAFFPAGPPRVLVLLPEGEDGTGRSGRGAYESRGWRVHEL